MSALCPETRYMQLVDPIRMIFRWVHRPDTDLSPKRGKVGNPNKAKKVIKDSPYLDGIV
jgi:hypothetical protein